MSGQKDPLTLEKVLRSLDRMYAAIKSTSSADLSKIDVRKIHGAEDGWLSIDIDFSENMSQAQLEVAAMTAIHNLSVFYDYCLPYATDLGISKDEVQDVVEHCLALRIARDLDNISKHPETPVNRSRMHPRLVDLRRVLQVTGGTDSASYVDFDIFTGKTKVHGHAALIVFGMVVNSKTNEPVMELNELLNLGVAAWEAFLSKHGIAS